MHPVLARCLRCCVLRVRGEGTVWTAGLEGRRAAILCAVHLLRPVLTVNTHVIIFLFTKNISPSLLCCPCHQAAALSEAIMAAFPSTRPIDQVRGCGWWRQRVLPPRPRPFLVPCSYLICCVDGSLTRPATVWVHCPAKPHKSPPAHHLERGSRRLREQRGRGGGTHRSGFCGFCGRR